jgi:hypothetical protein
MENPPNLSRLLGTMPVLRKYLLLLPLLLLLLTTIELPLGGGSTYTNTDETRINVHKRNNTKNTVQTIQNVVNTNIHITKTPTLFPKYP